MLSFSAIQAAYIDLYKQLRNYIWDFTTVRCIADLEVASYKAFPVIAEVRRHYNELQSLVSDIAREDEELRKALDALADLLNEDDNVFVKLNSVREVI